MGYSKSIEKQVLLASQRLCAMCAWLNDDWTPKAQIQIAHSDRNKNNNAPANLVVLCLNHHDQYDSITSQSKRITPHELREWKQKIEKRFSQEYTDSFPESAQELFTIEELKDIDLTDKKGTTARVCDSGHPQNPLPGWSP